MHCRFHLEFLEFLSSFGLPVFLEISRSLGAKKTLKAHFCPCNCNHDFGCGACGVCALEVV